MPNVTRVNSFGANDEVLIDRMNDESGIYIVTLNHAESLNTASVEMMLSIAKAFDSITALLQPDPNDTDVRAVILRGEGGAFCIGLDIGKLDEYFSGGIGGRTDPWRAMWECPFPIIGAVNGPAVTGGFEIALACDILLATPRAVFMDNHAKYGVHQGRRLSQRLIHLCGVNNAKLATMASFPIDGKLAFAWGLVQQLYPDNTALEEGAIQIAGMIARNHPMVVRRCKTLIEQGTLGTYREGIALETVSESLYYKELRDVDETLADGAAKFQAMAQWARSLE
jgi:enoyl-CoA hydratase/carnithine racemase